MTNYLEELNESQRNAVLYNEGPSLVIAGAGSGKTRVLTYKIAYLLERGYTPWSILALTFTNKAAREMKERIARQVGDQARYLWMGTFHSIFSRILRCEAQAVGFTSNFTIYDSSDSKSLIKSIVKEMQLDDKTYKPGVIQARISNAKNHLVFPDAYVSNAELYQYDLNAKVPATRDIYRRYWERCRQSDAMDFDDLLVYTYMLFRDHPEICRKYAEQFRYVLVDEYQDTNFAQHSIVLQLTQEHQRVCVVGDEQALDLILVLHHKGEVRDDHVHAVHVAVREHKAAVHDDHVAVALVHGHVLAHFAQTTQRVDVDGHSGLLGLLCAAGPPVIIRAAGAGTLFSSGFAVSVRIVLSLSRVLFFDLCHAVPPKSITKRRHTPLRAACLL